ncbi:hypothetical protein PHLCEN_2v219 [Hermanssonia centrifuga]|uniref:Uncharacterized protein n=1 Tax=Hermanssonia centrifuga TaxID=98765 RepID=A0A2R6S6L7_9APHY|nr:hypothetical protein PHLCEN_2v219 [Hermanssonia centrifuga]
MTTPSGALPLVVVGGSMELTDTARTRMATSAYPTLEEMVRDHDVAVPLPRHCFVYGIMWSELYLHILIHFPLYVPGTNGASGRWEFCQTLVAEHRVTFEEFPADLREYPMHNQDDLVLGRWRLTIALVSIRGHVSLLNEWMHPPRGPYPNDEEAHGSPS